MNLNDAELDPYDTPMTPETQRRKYANFETGKLVYMGENELVSS